MIAAVRADFVERVMKEPALVEVLGEGVELVRPMGRRDLVEALDRTAALVGVTWEAGLSDRLAESVDWQPGMLPAVQLAATALWEARMGTTLTWTAWRALGGLDGVLARRADEVLHGAPPAQQAIARELLLRLVHLDMDGRPVRRRLRREAIASLGASEREVLERLVSSGLVVTSEEGAELAHDALLLHWPRLASFLDEDRERLRWMGLLSAATGEWLRAGRRVDDLWWGRRLQDARRHLAGAQTLSAEERAFLDASAQLQRRSRRWRRGALVVPLAVLAVALALVVPSYLETAAQAEIQAIRSKVAADPADLRQRLSREVSPDLRWWALQLARGNGGEPKILVPSAGAALRVALSPSGDALAMVTSKGMLEVWNNPSSEFAPLAFSSRIGPAPVVSLSWDEPGGQLCLRQKDGGVWSWDGATLHRSDGAPASSSDPEILALEGGCVVGDATGLVRWFGGDGPPHTLLDAGAPVAELRGAASGDYLAVVSAAGAAMVLPSRPVGPMPLNREKARLGPLPADVTHVDWSADDRALAWATRGGQVGVTDLASGQVVHARETGSQLSMLRLLADGSVVGVMAGGELVAWTSDGWASDPVRRRLGVPVDRAVRGATRDLVFSAQGTILRYDPHTNWFMESIQICQDAQVAFSRDGEHVACVDPDGLARVLPVRAGYQYLAVVPRDAVADIALSLDGVGTPSLQVISRAGTVHWETIPLDGSPRAVPVPSELATPIRARFSHKGRRVLLSGAAVSLQEEGGTPVPLAGTEGALAMAWSAEDDLALVGDREALALWELPQGGEARVRWRVPVPEGERYAATFVRDAVVLGTSRTLSRLSLDSGAALSEIERIAKELRIEADLQRDWLYTLDGERGAVQVRDAQSLEVLGTDDSYGMQRISVSPRDGWTLVWDNHNGWLILYQREDRAWVPSIPAWIPFRPPLLQDRGMIGPNWGGALAEPAVAVDFSEDGRYLAVAASSGYIRVWDLFHTGSFDAGLTPGTSDPSTAPR